MNKQELIEKAVENYPNHAGLRQFEIDFKTEAQPIESNKIIVASNRSGGT